MFRLFLLPRFVGRKHRQMFVICTVIGFVCLVSLLNSSQPRSSHFQKDDAGLLFELPPPRAQLATAERIQMERRILIKEKCQEIAAAASMMTNGNHREQFGQQAVKFTVMDRIQMMYCDVPKVGN